MSGLLQFTVAVLFAAIFWSWRLAIIRWRAGGALVPFEPRRPVPWTGADLLCIALGYLVLNVIASSIASFVHETDGLGDLPQVTILLMGALASTAAVLAAALWIRLRHQATWTDLGLDLSRLRSDLLLGLAAFAVVSAPIYAIQACLTQLIPSEHPIIEALQGADAGWTLWLSSLVLAVVVAPLTEEFLFRVVLQGWLESLGSEVGTHGDHELMTADAIPSRPLRARWAPIVLSSAAFALMHLPRPDVVPLFFLALALGYLYRQTHRLWPSMVAHGCLNACSLGMLWFSGPFRP